MWLFFGIPKGYEKELEELWVDDISSTAHWQKFMRAKIGGWKECAVWVSDYSMRGLECLGAYGMIDLVGIWDGNVGF